VKSVDHAGVIVPTAMASTASALRNAFIGCLPWGYSLTLLRLREDDLLTADLRAPVDVRVVDLRVGALFVLRPRPDPLFLPPPEVLFTVAHARRSASSSGTPRFS